MNGKHLFSVFTCTSVVHSDIVHWLFQDTIAEVVGIMWMLFQPLLFGLIGAAVNFDNIKDLNSLGMYMFFFLWFMCNNWGSNLKHQILKHLILHVYIVQWKITLIFWLCFRIGYSGAGHWAICENHRVFLCGIWVRAHHQRTNLCCSCLVSQGNRSGKSHSFL